MPVPTPRDDQPGRPRPSNDVALRSPNGQTYGAVGGNWSRDGLGLYEISYQPNLRMSKHAHDLSRFILIVDGGVKHRLRSEEHCGRSDAINVPRHEMHEDFVGNSGARCFMVELGSPWLTRLGEGERSTGSLGFAGKNCAISGLLIRLRHECRLRDPAGNLIVDGLVLEMIGRAQRAGASGSKIAPSWVGLIRNLLHDRFRDPLTVRHLAGEAGVHPVHLCREFRRHTGSTIGAYQRRLRIEYACSELSRTNRTITEIALEAGFSSHAHFTSTFRGIVGMPPKMFRQIRAR
jgi:AraC family transcriptional regulator